MDDLYICACGDMYSLLPIVTSAIITKIDDGEFNPIDFECENCKMMRGE